METECKKLSVAVRAYCMHACLAIHQPLSKEASREANGVRYMLFAEGCLH